MWKRKRVPNSEQWRDQHTRRARTRNGRTGLGHTHALDASQRIASEYECINVVTCLYTTTHPPLDPHQVDARTHRRRRFRVGIPMRLIAACDDVTAQGRVDEHILCARAAVFRRHRSRAAAACNNNIITIKYCYAVPLFLFVKLLSSFGM